MSGVSTGAPPGAISNDLTGVSAGIQSRPGGTLPTHMTPLPSIYMPIMLTDTNPPSSFAAVALAAKDSEGFILPRRPRNRSRGRKTERTASAQSETGRKARKTKDLVVGKKVAGGLISWKGADLTTNVYIGYVDVNTSLEEVKEGINSQDVHVVELAELKRSHNRFKSFRLCIKKSDMPKITVPDFWPSGVVVRSFFWGKDNRSDASSAAPSAISSAASSARHDNRSDASRVTPPLQS